ncbi:aminotransferase LegC [Campylobacter jejuni]|uniref:Aminotransferase (DegT family) n=1 Tax=Campylobacter jejuni subsp. jejuni serotype O:2 (strain ATCC 700819 / NCTC 11168) TaxID=192222 RepID=Q0P8T7_CAMJE|nr:aminotransferase LegC [Campylobacter jejuni]YP_002344710.1 PLP-dependent aminotransferase [Campylobacter jejuni subsp. jejuni NCTC 11168 = ATCC 700819]AHK52450.1 aminotransferase DegT [Campylobacter jejuni subsp. jejuni NCTC 11168-K12E5]AHK54115.1 aminotransferase DegT [Campylobacter jejuni subsp. jejuni NCTC 11168-Kf1]AHK55781.1 aminotransferase DegT [Campylobacter jejuni subsp. jejuni NCTC 11168-mcK12E5]AHK57446.1 aminotransferase DegT [Campylobacter jejuni subsp. jejuni NCTC 11168-mfK12E
MFKKEISFIKSLFNKENIALHEPCFIGNEKKYLLECIDSGFVSSVGEFVTRFEEALKEKTKARFVIATNTGTAALHIALLANGIDENCEVITQSISFVATANAIAYTGAKPVFLDIDENTLSLSPKALEHFLENQTYQKDNLSYNKTTHKLIKACVIMHTFGLSAHIKAIKELCEKYHILLIEDAAEALGSTYENKALGTFGKCGILSFNGNKIITGGCGGAILSDDENLAKLARHLSTTAKIPHPYEYDHDRIAYNYRLCNINAAILFAGLENLELFLENKRELAKIYKDFFKNHDKCKFIDEKSNEKSNFWLNTLLFKNENLRNIFLEECLKNNIFVRPVWKSLPSLKAFQNCQSNELMNTKKLEKRLINLPSSVRIANKKE